MTALIVVVFSPESPLIKGGAVLPLRPSDGGDGLRCKLHRSLS